MADKSMTTEKPRATLLRAMRRSHRWRLEKDVWAQAAVHRVRDLATGQVALLDTRAACGGQTHWYVAFWSKNAMYAAPATSERLAWVDNTWRCSSPGPEPITTCPQSRGETPNYSVSGRIPIPAGAVMISPSSIWRCIGDGPRGGRGRIIRGACVVVFPLALPGLRTAVKVDGT